LRACEEVHRKPVFEALQALGGSAAMARVLERDLQGIKGVLWDVAFPLDCVTPVPFV
jgi:hypothetical protein